jgi:hypothetical protein
MKVVHMAPGSELQVHIRRAGNMSATLPDKAPISDTLVSHSQASRGRLEQTLSNLENAFDIDDKVPKTSSNAMRAPLKTSNQDQPSVSVRRTIPADEAASVRAPPRNIRQGAPVASTKVAPVTQTQNSANPSAGRRKQVQFPEYDGDDAYMQHMTKDNCTHQVEFETHIAGDELTHVNGKIADVSQQVSNLQSSMKSLA